MRKTTLRASILALWCLAAGDRVNAVDVIQSSKGLADAGALAGELIELQADSRTFAALYSPHEGAAARGAVVLLHDQATNLNSREVIRPLRLGLSAAGWVTLTLALPASYPGETRSAWLGRQDAIVARLKAGLDWLATREVTKHVVVALGDSAPIALRFAAEEQPAKLRALVIISSTLQRVAPNDDLAILGNLKLPLLDIYAERDLTHITENAAVRRRAAAANRGYRQSAIPSAVAGYQGLEDHLLHSIHAWLANQVGDDRPTPAR